MGVKPSTDFHTAQCLPRQNILQAPHLLERSIVQASCSEPLFECQETRTLHEFPLECAAKAKTTLSSSLCSWENGRDSLINPLPQEPQVHWPCRFASL